MTKKLTNLDSALENVAKFETLKITIDEYAIWQTLKNEHLFI